MKNNNRNNHNNNNSNTNNSTTNGRNLSNSGNSSSSSSNNSNTNNSNRNNRKRRNSDKHGPFNKRQRNNQDYRHKETKPKGAQAVISAAQQENLPSRILEEQQIQTVSHNEKVVTEPLKKCILCNKVISEIGTAIKQNNTEEYIHFDCAIKDIREKEKPYPNERICYLGKGTFGIIKFLSYSSGPIKFLIRKRIQYEGTE